MSFSNGLGEMGLGEMGRHPNTAHSAFSRKLQNIFTRFFAHVKASVYWIIMSIHIKFSNLFYSGAIYTVDLLHK